MGEGEKGHEVTLPGYWIGRYPVTNAQYAAFIAAGGYGVAEHWEEAPQQMVLRLAHEVLDTPASVVLARNVQPKRVYPWGDEITTEHANYNATGVGATSAVGCFAQGTSPYGVLEMSGNV
jgi:formylglycine-generating enzyme required for sulfatase activity